MSPSNQAAFLDAPEGLNLRPNLPLVLFVSGTAAGLSFLYLSAPFAAASTVLMAFMIAGADVDARTFLLPDVVTYGATIAGLIAAPLLAWENAGESLAVAILRAFATAALLAALRAAYARLRQRQGLGFGDIKLAAAVGAWLPVFAIPYCFALATMVALVSVFVLRRGGELNDLRLPFGAFLCPALWLVFFVSSLPY